MKPGDIIELLTDLDDSRNRVEAGTQGVVKRVHEFGGAHGALLDVQWNGVVGMWQIDETQGRVI